MSERAVITGVLGQDGRILASQLVAEGLEVHGFARSLGSRPAPPGVTLHECDVRDRAGVAALLRVLRPAICFHLAARHRSSGATSESLDQDRDVFDDNLAMAEAVLFGVAQECPAASMVLAGSCQMFGAPPDAPQTERTPFAPRNAYAIAKTAACELGRLARARGLRVSTAILFQHESPWRPSGFLSHRIAHGVAAVVSGERDDLELGDPDAIVDWTWAADAMDALVRMARADVPRELVVASGEARSVRQLAQAALAHAGLSTDGRLRANPALVRESPRPGMQRPVPYVGDASAIRAVLGWRPTLGPEAIMARLVDAALGHRGASRKTP